MKFDYQWIQELSGIDTPAQEAASLLNAKACETEDLGDGLFDCDILPNRPDLLSHVGLARELAALSGKQFNGPDSDALASGQGSVSVHIEDGSACTRYSGLIVRGVRVGPSPEWLRNRLERVGVGSVNNVVDVVNYLMLEIGQPMHAFDLARLSGGIVVRRAKRGERLVALDDARTEYELDEDTLVIADDSGPVAIAGIKGGVTTAVSEDTRDVFLEAAVFDSSIVRAGSTKLGLRTDASVRFSYGVSTGLPLIALMRAAAMLTELAGGTADAQAVDAYPKPWHSVKLTVSTAYTGSLLGADIKVNDMVAILSRLGFSVHASDHTLEVSVPQWRLDIERQEDLVEEIGRVHGYNEIEAVPPVVHAYDERSWVRDDEDVPWDEYGHIRERQNFMRLLASDGFSEVYNYAFYSDELVDKLGLDHLHELALPQSSHYRWLRTSLVPRLLLVVRDNLRFEKNVRLMETGHVFDHLGGLESTRLALATVGPGTGEDRFYELKGAVDHLAAELGITDLWFDDAEPFFADAAVLALTARGRCANIKDKNGKMLGFIGQVAPNAAASLRIKHAGAVVELDLRALVRHAQAEREYEPLPKYPAVERDISMFVSDEVRVRQILEAIHAADEAGLVRDVDVMDIFVPTGDEKLAPEYSRHEYGKSIAVRIVFRSDERTLTDEEVTVVEDTIKRALQDRVDARVR